MDANREREIFNKAFEIASPEERSGYLLGACGDDDDMRAKIERMLCDQGAAAKFFPTMPDGDPEIDVATITEGEGSTIGPYKLLQKIGEGGFGIVYMAEQKEPVKRRVALKIIKLGMDTKQVVGRFEAERQALALMDHPNIAKVIDAGATQTGRPYFAMELVRGVPILQFCDEERLTTGARIQLFLQICGAIQHAHQKGIIHRDIKPSNLLVSLHDDQPVPKVIDFGIAKATQHELTDKTLFTRFEDFIGTPAYMSPEQMQMNALDIDTRSDIYSLGVLLYQLLTGSTPFGARELLSGSQEDMRRRIREELPPKPSTRVHRLPIEATMELAQRQRASPGQLASTLRGDLDCIVMKALEKDRSRRYESAAAFARDLQRHLNDEPIAARAPSWAYRLQKLVRRRRGAVAAMLTTTTAAVLGAFGLIYGLIKQHEGKRIAQREAAAASISAERARATAEALSDMILTGSPFQSGHYSVHEMLIDHQEKLAKHLSEYPEIEAKLRKALAHVLHTRDEPDAAERHLKRALNCVTEAGLNGTELEAGLHEELSLLYRQLRRYQQAYEHNARAFELHQTIFGANHIKTLRSRLVTYIIVRGFDEPVIPIPEVLAGLDELAFKAEPRLDEPAYNDLFVQARYYGVTVAINLEDLDLAERYCDERMQVLLRSNPEHHPSVVSTLQHQAEIKRLQGQFAAAFDLLRDAQARTLRWFPDGDAPMCVDLIIDEAKTHKEAKSYAQMEEASRRALAEAEKKLGKGHKFIGDAKRFLREAQAAQGKHH